MSSYTRSTASWTFCDAAEWFVPLGEAHHVMWWVPEGHRPTLGEARERLDLLRSAGPTEKAFTFRDTFAAI
ncbi:hypothetical protein GCM10020218_005360 [Dactylosporangium vinaceum]